MSRRFESHVVQEAREENVTSGDPLEQVEAVTGGGDVAIVTGPRFRRFHRLEAKRVVKSSSVFGPHSRHKLPKVATSLALHLPGHPASGAIRKLYRFYMILSYSI